MKQAREQLFPEFYQEFMRYTVQAEPIADSVSPSQNGIDYHPCQKLWGTRDWTLKGLKEYLMNLNIDQRSLEEEEAHKKAEIRTFKKRTAQSQCYEKAA